MIKWEIVGKHKTPTAETPAPTPRKIEDKSGKRKERSGEARKISKHKTPRKDGEKREKMTRKDFEKVAEIVAILKNGEPKTAGDWEIDAILRSTNPNFDPVRFWRAVDKYAEAKKAEM